MQIAIILYFALLGLVAANLALVLELPLWLAPLVLVAAIGTAFAARRVLLPWLAVLGTVFLSAVALTLAIPAWQTIDSGASGSWAGRMAPMLVAALALYLCILWMGAARGERHAPLERVARLLSGPHLLPTLATSVILSAALILALEWLAGRHEAIVVVTQRFLDRGVIPPITVLLFFWGLLLLLGKRWNGWHLHRAIGRWTGRSAGGRKDGAVGRDADAAPGGREKKTAAAGREKGSIAAGLDALAAAPASLDENMQFLRQRFEESYLLPRYISWAVPVLGFIGTVLGISLAAEGIRRIIVSDTGLTGLSSDLGNAIAPLGIAFDTTLIALSLSVVLTLLLSLVQRSEERMLSTLEWELREAARRRPVSGGFRGRDLETGEATQSPDTVPATDARPGPARQVREPLASGAVAAGVAATGAAATGAAATGAVALGAMASGAASDRPLFDAPEAGDSGE